MLATKSVSVGRNFNFATTMYHKMSFIGVPPEVVRLASNRRGSLDPKTATEHSMGVEEEEQHYGQRPMYQLIPAAVHNTENRVETQPEAAVKYPVEHVMRIAGEFKC